MMNITSMKHGFLSRLSKTMLLLPVVAGGVAALGATPPSNAWPGKGLAEHDFFYAGEAKEENMCQVRGIEL